MADDKFLNMRVGFYPMTEDESFIIPDRNKIETAKIITNVYESNVLGYQNWLWIADSLEYETNWQDFIWEFPSKVHKYVNDVYDVIGSTELLKDNTLHTSPSLS
ncbi:MAG: hypothetical protein IPL09_05800 [Bacteroidetes bacterium]|nr:hypothetical protein [Bacteroidota bacterium]